MSKVKKVRIELTIEVESIDALRTILKVGSEYSLYDYKIINFRFPPSKNEKERKNISNRR